MGSDFVMEILPVLGASQTSAKLQPQAMNVKQIWSVRHPNAFIPSHIIIIDASLRR